MTRKLYRVHGLLFIDVTYETHADVPPEFEGGRELEYMESQGFPDVMTLSTNPHVVGLEGQSPTWNVEDANLRIAYVEVAE